jgi:acyl-CoA thioesterase I
VSPLFLYFASGESLYSGALLLIVAIVISMSRKISITGLRGIAAWLGLAMMIMACPPFSGTVDALFGAAFLVWFIAINKDASRSSWSRIRVGASGVLISFVLVLSAVEFSHRKMPVILGPAGDHLVVIGDSISSGLDSRTPAWPSLMQRMTGIEVRNLARPGATTQDARTMARQVLPEDHIVLLEIGGNDLIGDTSASEFGRQLNALIAQLTASGRTIAMFELPLLPQKIEYGQVQRRLAAKYGVVLIPKRFLARVMTGVNATTDGLHLSSVGAQRMVAIVTQVFVHVLKARPTASTTPATHP